MRRALHTPEILEMILLQVDMRTLLTFGQRVCHAWKNLIRTSRFLQRALFFMPIQESEWAAGEKTLNPLLAEAFPSIFPAKYKCDERFSIPQLPMAKDSEAMAIFGRRDASWRRMLVQQPPLSHIGVFHVRHTRVGNRVKRSSAPAYTKSEQNSESGPVGLRMEKLFEYLLFSHGGPSGRRHTKRVYGSTEAPIKLYAHDRRISKQFHQVMTDLGVVAFTYEVVPCGMGIRRRPPSGNDKLIREIVAAYEYHPLEDDYESSDHDWYYDSDSLYRYGDEILSDSDSLE
ncbi:hypothetical protein BJX68DRAFT_255799 [Aspergillus pseudodeflectus]|uniref:F-box domain-containing protein n=1 Tax=Aspergillus pseudodeflectus TaxID=176178 RepID=A0ABR4K952_9EURO